MDAYAMLDRRVRKPRIDRTEERVHGLVAADAENRGTEDAPTRGIDDDLHEALRLAFLDGTCDARHRPLADQHAGAVAHCFGLGHADATERRVDEKAVDR